MLLRAALRALRSCPSPLRTASSPIFSRAFAKNSKHKRPIDYKPPAHSSPNVALPKQESPSQKFPQSEIGSTAAAALNSNKFGATDPATARRLEAEENGYTSDNISEKPYPRPQEELDATSTSKINNTSPDSSPSAAKPAEASQEEQQPQIPLHDLTKGIPSTLDAELAEAARRQDEADRKGQETEGAEESQVSRPAPGGRGGRQMPASAYITSAERRRNSLMNWVFAGMVLTLLAGPIYLGRDWESEEEEKAHPDAPSGWGLRLFYNRAMARLFSTLDYYKEPAFLKLLPDPEPAWERPYTLVLSLEDLLVHSEWTREHGWRMAKRPGVDYFLRYLSQYYEIVIFTSVSSMIAGPILQKLDPFGIVMWRLFREATRYTNGEYVKDLSFLNRDPSKIIVLDTDPSHTSTQPENSIILPKWTGNPQDKDLVAFIPFLEYVAAMQLNDTRKVLSSFTGKHIPTEWSARETEARRRFNQELAEERKRRPRRGSGVGFLGSALGIKGGAGGGMEMTDGGLSLSEGFEQGKMLHDQIRERGQRQYELIEKEIRENGEEWLRQIAAEDEKAKEEQMRGMKAGLKGWFGGGKGGEKK